MARLPDIPTDLWRQFQQTIFGEKADDIQQAESFRWGVDDALGQLPPDDGTDWQAEARRLEEEQRRRQEEQQRQLEEQARLDQEDYQRIADERAVAAQANELARNAPPGTSTSTYNDPTAGGTQMQPLSFGDTANSLIAQAFGPESPPVAPPMPEDASQSERYVYRGADQQPGPMPPPLRNDIPYEPATNTYGPGSANPPEPLSFADTANSLMQQAFGPEIADTREADQGPHELPREEPGFLDRIAGLPGKAATDLGRLAGRFAPKTGFVEGLQQAYERIPGEGDYEPRPSPPMDEASRLFVESTKHVLDPVAPAVRSALERAGIDPDTAYQAAQDVSGVLGPEALAVGMTAFRNPQVSEQAINAVKALRAAGVADDVLLAAERHLAEGADMALSAVQKLTRGAERAAEATPIPNPAAGPAPGDRIRLPDGTRARVEEPVAAGASSTEASAERFWASADNPAVQRRRMGEDIDDLVANPDVTQQVSNTAGDVEAANKRAATVQVARERGVDVHWVRDTAQEQAERERGITTPWEYWQLRSGAEPPAGPQPGDRVRLPDGTRATVTEGSNGAAPPTGRPPAPPDIPPPPPEGGRQMPLPGIPEPPPEDLTHVRGFGILQGVDPVGREILERAAAKGRQFPQGVPRADPAEAAVRLGMAPEDVAARWLRQDTREAADEIAVLRQGVAASLDDVQAAARRAREGTLSAEDQMTAIDGLVNAAVGGEFMRGGRRAAESAGRALNQFRSAVSVQAARGVYDAMEAAAQAAGRTRVVLSGLKNGKVPNEAGLRQLEQTAASLEGAAGRDLLGEGGEAVRRRARRDAGLPEPAVGTPEAGGAPKEPSFAERWGQLKRAHTRAEEAGDVARAQDISDQISALSAEVRADAIERAREAVAATKKPITAEEAQRIVDERLGQGAVSRIRREEMEQAKGFTAGKLQADLDRDVQRKVLAALRKAEAQQDALLKSLDIQTQRGIERAMAQEKRAEVRDQAKAMANQAKQWMDRAKRDPSNMAFRDEFDQQLREMSEHSNVGEVLAADLREQFATHLDEHAFGFMADLEKRVAGAESSAIAAERAGIQKEALQGMAQRLRDTVTAIHQHPNQPGLLEEVDRLMADMTAVSTRGFEMSQDIKQSLTKAGLVRFAGKLSADQVEQFTSLLRTIDPDDPRALGNVMAYIRRGHALDRLREFSVANMLSSTATAGPTGVNNIANALSTVAHYGFKLPGMALTESVRTAGGRRGAPELTFGDVGAAYRAALGAFGPSLQDAVSIMRHGSTTRQAERASQLADFGGSHPELLAERPQSLADAAKLRWGVVGEFLHFLSTRQLEASDAFWSGILESGNYAGLAARKARMTGARVENILANPLDHMDVLDQATRMSRYTLLKQRSVGTRVLSGLTTAGPDASLSERVGKFAAQQVIPFTTTPLNSVLQLLEYSPGGALVQGTRAALTKDAFARAELTNKALAGATLAGVGIVGIQSTVPDAPSPEWTWITGAPPVDTEKRKALEAQGWQANSIWNPTSRTYNSVMGTPLAPVLVPAWALQGFTDAVEKGERKGTVKEWEGWLTEGLGGSAKRLAGSVIEQTFLRSVGDIVQGVGQQGDISRVLASEVTRYFPGGSLVAQLARLGDASQREAKSFSERVVERTPFRGMLPERQGPLGEALPNDMAGIMGAVLPSPRRTAEHSNPTYQAFEQAGVDIGAPKTTLSLDPGLSIPLTPDEQRRWQTLRGDVLQKVAPKLQQKPWWNKPLARTEAMTTILADAGEAADGRLIKEIGGEEIRRRAREATAQMRAKARAS